MDHISDERLIDLWKRATDRLAQAEERFRQAQGRGGRRAEEEARLARYALAEARESEPSKRRQIADRGVGADPRRWGSLSGWPGFNLERTIDGLLSPLPPTPPAELPETLAEALREIRGSLHQARIEAHEGDRSLADGLDLRLADALEEVAPDESVDAPTKRRLMHHLPGGLRPIPRVDPSTLGPRKYHEPGHVRFGTDLFDPESGLPRISAHLNPEGELTLGSIVAAPQGRGLGSAGLEHLCRSADHYGLTVVGEIVATPLPGDDEEARRKDAEGSRRLAGWYGRFGFTVEPKDGGSLRRARIRREPQG